MLHLERDRASLFALREKESECGYELASNASKAASGTSVASILW